VCLKAKEWSGLESLTNKQTESLSKVEDLTISEALLPLVDKYKKQ
jgi:hypothetical protein